MGLHARSVFYSFQTQDTPGEEHVNTMIQYRPHFGLDPSLYAYFLYSPTIFRNKP